MTINVGRKELIVLLGVLGFFVLVGLAVAYGGNNPSVLGHSAGEVMVNVEGKEVSLQEAIDGGMIGG